MVLRLYEQTKLPTDTPASIFLDDLSLQLLDGHAGATRRRCNHNLDFQGKKIRLLGAGKEKTVIDCGGVGTELSAVSKRGLIFVSGEGRDTIGELQEHRRRCVFSERALYCVLFQNTNTVCTQVPLTIL